MIRASGSALIWRTLPGAAIAFAGTIHDPAAQAHPDAASEVHPGISAVRPIGATTNSAYRSLALAKCAPIKRAGNVGFLGGERRNTEIAECPFLNPEGSQRRLSIPRYISPLGVIRSLIRKMGG